MTADIERQENGQVENAKPEKTRGVFRFLWYVFATILVLSLPTFSYLVPDPQYSFVSRFGSGESSSPGEEQVTPKQVSDPDYALGRRLLQSAHRRTSPGTRRVFSSLSSARPGRPGRLPSRRPANTVTAGTRPGTQDSREEPGSVPRIEPPQSGPMDVPVGMGEVQNDLAQLEQGYQRIASNMSYRARMGRINPFQDALEGGSGTGNDGEGDNSGNDTNGDSNGDSNGDNSTPPPDSGDSGDSGTDGGAGDPNVDVVDTPTGTTYRFLIVGDFPGNRSSSLVSRGNSGGNGEFTLENFFRFTFFPGGLHSLFLLDQNTTLLTDDLNGDGQIDFLTTQLLPKVGTRVDASARSGGGFRTLASAFFYFRAIRSVALFDFNRDGQLELALLFEGEDNLFIYQFLDKGWTYLKEIVLPFETAAIFTARFLENEPPALFLLDRAYSQVATVTQEQPNLFQFGLNFPLSRLRTLAVRWQDGSPESLMAVLELDDRIVIVPKVTGKGTTTLASLNTTGRIPFLLIGDYSDNGTRQIVFAP